MSRPCMLPSQDHLPSTLTSLHTHAHTIHLPHHIHPSPFCPSARPLPYRPSPHRLPSPPRPPPTSATSLPPHSALHHHHQHFHRQASSDNTADGGYLSNEDVGSSLQGFLPDLFSMGPTNDWSHHASVLLVRASAFFAGSSRITGASLAQSFNSGPAPH